MKKILVLNYEFPPLGGGAGNATYYLLKEFAKENDLSIDLITSSLDEYKEETFSDNIRIYYLNIDKRGNIHYQSNKDLIKYSLRAYKLAKKLNQQNRYDLVHAFFGIPCGFIAMLLKRPYIVSLRGSDVPFYNKRFYWLDKIVFRYLSRLIWKKAKAVVTNSQGLKDLALKTSPKQEIFVIYNGVDIKQFHPIEKNNKEFIIISTSRLIKRKGVEYLINAFIEFQKKYHQCQLIIVGDGNLKDEFMNSAILAGVNQKIKFVGSVEHDKLPFFYQQADVFVLPSLNEGMSNSLLEAMASGLAVIATNTGGTNELVDSLNGIIIKQNDVAVIYDSLIYLFNNKKLLENMKNNSRKKAVAFSWTKAREQYMQCYHLK